ncbi:MAG: hypothetical protein R6V49_04815 [Bacteroidales bacterium]
MRKEILLLIAVALMASMMALTGCGKDDEDDKPVELTPREKAIKDYTDNYIGSYVDDPVWTGNPTNCVAGTISQDSRDKVIQRLNYFRRLVGLSDNVTENPDQHQGCQEASLIFKAQNNLSHFPPQSWKCWTQAGRSAAETSNIAWGTASSGGNAIHTTRGISGFIEDEGANNKEVGHRAWFLMPGLFKLGVGSTNSTCCMQWKDNYNTTGTSPEFIAYPPKGYVPNQVVFPRWSFAIPTGATFTNATVTMTDANGANVSLNIVNKPANQPGSYPLRHLVWEPNINVTNIAADATYTVTINNIQGAPQTSYTYEVIVIPVTPSFKKSKADTDIRIFMSIFG